MPALLLDEMYPPAAAHALRERHDRDCVPVAEVGLRATADATVAQWARAEHRPLVTENVSDFAAEPDLVLVVVLKRHLPAGSAMAPALALLLDGWIETNPNPYVGHHWPM